MMRRSLLRNKVTRSCEMLPVVPLGSREGNGRVTNSWLMPSYSQMLGLALHLPTIRDRRASQLSSTKQHPGKEVIHGCHCSKATDNDLQYSVSHCQSCRSCT